MLSHAAFEKLAAEALNNLPSFFQEKMSNVELLIELWPSLDALKQAGVPPHHTLLGLYSGIPLTEKSVFDQPLGPDIVWLFREPILAEWRDRGNLELADLVAHVTVHEFAHHFGWSDDDIATIDRWWE